MLKSTISKFIAVFAIAAVMVPSMALARGNDDHKDDDSRERSGKMEQVHKSTNEFGVRIFGEDNEQHREGREDHKENRGHDRHHLLSNLFYSGEVTAVSDSGFTVKTNKGETLTVNASSAKIVRIPHDVINLSDVQVGDTVHVTGTKVDSTITASVVYDMSKNLKPGVAKGTVTAVTDTSITVETKDNQTVTINTDGDTRVTDENGDVAATSDIEVGAKVKTFGLWDTVLNVFNAIRIKLF